MISTKDKDLNKILSEIRTCLMELSNSNKTRGFDWHKRKDLKCACAISSVFVSNILSQIGYNCEIVQGVFLDWPKITKKDKFEMNEINHCWVQIENTIVDLTASQFGESDIVISSDNEKFIPLKIVNVKKFNLRHFSGWPKTQKPSKSILKTLMEVYHEKTKLAQKTA